MIAESLYQPIFIYTVMVLTVLVSAHFAPDDFKTLQDGRKNFGIAALTSLVMALWLGLRPLSGAYFGDTSQYAHVYELMQDGVYVAPENNGEWVWMLFMFACSKVMSVSGFFTLVSLGYFGFTLWACRRLTPNNVLATLLMVMGSLSFFSYAVNGIRNGLACSMVLVVFTLVGKSRKDNAIALLLAFIAINIHRTVMLPLATMLISVFLVRDFKWAYSFWLLSIVVSLLFGNQITALFAGLGFDDRLSYLTDDVAEEIGHTGFRWDFLVYSMLPILLGYYIVIRRGIKDRRYLMLLNTYTLANAFWVMVIRANFSNRFAYLSWFMFPLLLAYPLLRLNIWKDLQGYKLQQIMFANIGFTWFMNTFYW